MQGANTRCRSNGHERKRLRIAQKHSAMPPHRRSHSARTNKHRVTQNAQRRRRLLRNRRRQLVAKHGAWKPNYTINCHMNDAHGRASIAKTRKPKQFPSYTPRGAAETFHKLTGGATSRSSECTICDKPRNNIRRPLRLLLTNYDTTTRWAFRTNDNAKPQASRDHKTR